MIDPRTERLNRGKSIRGMAREIAVPEQSIRRLEAGHGISPEYAKRIADFLACQVVDLPPFFTEPEEVAA